MSSVCFLKTSTLKLNPGNTNDLGPIASVVKQGQVGILFCFETKASPIPFFFSFKEGEQET